MALNTVLAWMLNFRSLTPEVQPSTLGAGPIPEALFDTYLRQYCGLQPTQLGPTTSVLVLGYSGWTTEQLDWILDVRQGGELKVYSQELYISYLVNGRDPLLAPDDWISLFRQGHPALEYLASLGFAWPTVVVPCKSSGEVSSVLDAPELGLLKYLGYKVGSRGLDATARREILSEAFLQARLPSELFDAVYIESWGPPSTSRRLQKLAKSIAAFATSGRARGPAWSSAVNDWESDLEWLRVSYYSGRFRFAWPSTQM